MEPKDQFKKEVKGLLNTFTTAEFIRRRNKSLIKAALLICVALTCNLYGYTWVNYICYPVAAFFVYMAIAFAMYAKGMHNKHL